ncbi:MULTISPECIES: hypothetical protein [Clostridium]|jgi:hypothetical protein|uniref:Uncharacterized protein n=1 Tax=Clostridium intestinale DSM 6191 TaxID=1121320 RepID=A0A1M5U5D8_9CLOT|nr:MULTISPECIES: hypothetical protein [Clostridium]SHH58242.1 hypothetical protein SAMN02745941_00414 [Clostridium intestinale DSM 6191]
MVVIVITIYIIIVFIDQVTLFKSGEKRDFYVSAVMCLISFIIAILLALKISIYSPAKLIESLIKNFLGKL